MSGTSLDGLDLACVRFTRNGESFSYKVLAAETVPYSALWQQRLRALHNTDAHTFARTHTDLGRLFAELSLDFCKRNHLHPEYISSHGHTVFHNPAAGYSVQAGHGAVIAAVSGIPVICDFRSLDVALGGQGAPLVPIGDALLFDDYDCCLNLGGIANLSIKDQAGQMRAWDVCPANMVLNKLVEPLGLEYDDAGKMARSGNLNTGLLHTLNEPAFFKSAPPKSLGREWVEHEVFPVLHNSFLNVACKLRTYTEHIALQLARSLQNQPGGTMLISGGGAFNTFLVERIQAALGSAWQAAAADKQTTAFKEAIVFALLGMLRVTESINTPASVTGARKDSCGGCIYLP